MKMVKQGHRKATKPPKVKGGGNFSGSKGPIAAHHTYSKRSKTKK